MARAYLNTIERSEDGTYNSTWVYDDCHCIMKRQENPRTGLWKVQKCEHHK